MDLNTDLIYKAIYELCIRANTVLPKEVYEKLQNFYDRGENIHGQIMENAYLANLKKRPLCQDTGQVVVFLEIGQNIQLKGDWIENAINNAVNNCYRENFYRKSTVKNALNNRENTGTNTPVIIHNRIVEGEGVKILLGLKGGGAENTSQVKMFNPTASREEIFEFVKQVAKDAGENACPPMMLGVGIGGTIEVACILAKKALYTGEVQKESIKNVFETKMLTTSTHIASMPVCVNVNCHSARHCSCEIKNGEIIFEKNEYEILPPKNIEKCAIEIFTNEVEKIKQLKNGQEIELTGVIYTARDAAHKKLVEIIEQGEKLPIELQNAIIFYAGPCPSAPNEIIGPIGPTTSKRMDKFAPILYKNGVLATIGKGERTINEGIYFKSTGGVASLLQKCVKKAELVAFEELGAEAIYKLEVEKFPITCAGAKIIL